MHRRRTLKVLAALCSAITLLLAPRAADAQGPGRRGGPRGMGNFDWMRMRGEANKEEAKKDEDKDKDKDKDKEKSEGEKPAEPEEKPDEGPPPVRRPEQPSRPPNPGELNVAPDEEGKISFSFKGQPWPSVLEWLADISDMSLEWEEAPAGFLDLTTRGRYTVDEVRDLINSVLLNKGFTLLRNGEVLIVANLKKLDSSLVPRVTSKELDQRGTYELVKVFFDLDWLMAAAAAEEFKPLLSPFGKISALKATNRLDVLDTAGNLRRIRELIAEEQSDNGQQRLVREFKLRYTRASEVLDTLNTLLGIEPKQSMAMAAMDPRQQQMMLQQMMMAQQQGGGGMAAGKAENTVFLAVNPRENSILANAPPDKMGVIEQAVTAVDVPQHRGESLMGNVARMQVYRLSGLAPETLIKVLKELGGLDPTTKLEIDTKKGALIAYAPLVDHVLIRSLVERLDGTGRKFEVIQLRTLSAEYVAGSIMTLMNGPEKTDDSRNRNRFFYFDSSQEQDNTDKFWVEADIERNRLLLKANDAELNEVRALLAKLGEVPADERYGNMTRVVPAVPGEETFDAIERVRQLWESVSPNPLEIEPGAFEPPRRRQPPGGRRRQPGPAAQPDDAQEQSQEGDSRDARTSPASPNRYRFAQDRRAVASDAEPEEEVSSDESEQQKPPESESPQQASAAEPAEGQPASDPNESDVPLPEGATEQPTGEPEASAADDRPAAETPAAPAETGPSGNEPDEADLPGEPEEPATDTDGQVQSPARSTPGLTDQESLPRKAHAPVRITFGPQGLIVSSSDTEALDRMEELLNQMIPTRTSYKVFTLKHTYAKDIALLLKDVFKEDMAKESSRSDVFNMFWNGYGGSSTQKARATLGRRRPLGFVADPVTNTLLVQGADTSQLAEIESLIEVYDKAEIPNSESVRRTTRVALRYAKAKDVADLVKDVYRDLLSPNDRALLGSQPPQPPQQQRGGGDNFYSAMFSYLSEDPRAEVVPRFKGMLSVGIDEKANGVVVSAPQILLTEVLKMVEDVDRAARPSRPVVRVLAANRPGLAAQVRQALANKKIEGSSVPAAETGNGGAATSTAPRPTTRTGGGR